VSARRPHVAWYALAVLPLAAGIYLAIRFLLGMIDDIDSMQRVDVPGVHELYLQPGDHVVYAEGNDDWSGRCRLSAADGAAIELDTPGGRTSYSMGGHSGESVFVFTAPREGGYQLACEGEHGTLAVGHGIGLTIVGVVLAPIGGMLLAGLTVALVFLWRRRG
jgi:hypothetical protein